MILVWKFRFLNVFFIFHLLQLMHNVWIIWSLFVVQKLINFIKGGTQTNLLQTNISLAYAIGGCKVYHIAKRMALDVFVFLVIPWLLKFLHEISEISILGILFFWENIPGVNMDVHMYCRLQWFLLKKDILLHIYMQFSCNAYCLVVL